MTELKIRNPKITGKLIVHGRLLTTAPLLIGKGKGDEADTEVMVMPGSNKPYIPGSSLAGALRSRFKNIDQGTAMEAFWGSKEMKINGKTKNETIQSHLIVDDLQLTSDSKANVVIRDGVAINPQTGVAVTFGKYDYQLVETGAVFELRMELTSRSFMNVVDQKVLFKYLYTVLTSDDFRIGALTGFGFGRFELKALKSWEFDFKKEESRSKWFEYIKEKRSFHWEAGEINWNKIVSPPIEDPNKKFQLAATFVLKSALISGSYGVKSGDPDKAQLTSNGKYVLSGKSIKGAIRHRALKILNTVLPQQEARNHELIDNLLGWVKHENDPYKYLNKERSYGKKSIRSRVRIEETDLDKAVKPMTQDRIKIDRFTGGVLHGAKFESQPVWKDGSDGFTITFTLFDYKDWEAALLLHLIKDLWTEDLPVGGEKNVGRGILVGQSAIIQWKDNLVKLEKKGEELQGDIDKLAPFNGSLIVLITQQENNES